MKALLRYLICLKTGKLVLWCYLIWYLVVVYYHFDPRPTLWLTSLGLSAIIGTGLLLSVSAPVLRSWQTLRLYLMPFCVSSFAALIKNQGFVVVFPTVARELISVLTACSAFIVVVLLLKYRAGKLAPTARGCALE